MISVRKAFARAALAAVVLSAGAVTAAMAGPASVAPTMLTMQASSLVADLKAQGESALPVVQVQQRRGGPPRAAVAVAEGRARPSLAAFLPRPLQRPS